MDRTKTLEESLREASCIGDIELVEELVNKGVSVNAKHNLNGWTPLHWAAKRGHKAVVALLLSSGANSAALTSKGETPVSLCTNPEVRQLLGGESDVPKDCGLSLPITPYYLKHQPLNGKVELPTTMSRRSQPDSDMVISNSNQSVNSSKIAQQANGSVHSEELVLKVRVANTGDPDFIEVELPRTELTYSRLLRVCCKELGVNASQVLRVRKLPDTLVRKDKDVQRFHDFQEIEVVITAAPGKSKIAGSNGLIIVPGLGGSNANGYQSISLYKNQTILY